MPEVLGGDFVETITAFVNMLIALWMIPVMVAGQLLTNTFVYGEFLGFDKTLWHMWNMSKIFANYAIGFIFIYSIFRYFFATKEGDFNVIKSILPKIVVASLVVNMSWFILGFLLDLSTLMIAALGNLPAVFIDDNPKIHKEVTVAEGTLLHLGSNEKGIVEKAGTQTVALDNLLAWENSAAGPLFYLGNNIIQINDLAIQDSAGEKKIENISPIFLIKIMVVLAFMIPIIILIFINLVRIFRIWLYVAFAPLIALDIVFGSKVGGKFPDNNAFVIGNLLGMVFQPVLVVGSLSLAVIMIAGIQNSLTNPTDAELEDARKELQIGSVSGEGGTLTNGWTLDTMVIMSWKEKLKNSGGPIGWFLLTFLSIFLLWALVRASFKFGNVSSKIGGKMMDFTKDAAKTVPIFGGKHSVGSLQYTANQVGAFPESFVAPQTKKLHGKIEERFGMDLISDMPDLEYRNMKREFGSSETWKNSEYSEFKDILSKQKITNGKQLEFTENVALLYKQLLLKMLATGDDRIIFSKHNKFTSKKLNKLAELDTDDFKKNFEVQELLDIIIKNK